MLNSKRSRIMLLGLIPVIMVITFFFLTSHKVAIPMGGEYSLRKAVEFSIFSPFIIIGAVVVIGVLGFLLLWVLHALIEVISNVYHWVNEGK